jgi:hypothetical protein
MLGAVAVVPGASGELPAESTSMSAPTESVSLPESGSVSVPDSASVDLSVAESESMPESGEDSSADSSEADPGDENAPESLPEDGSEAPAPLEETGAEEMSAEEPAADPVAVTVPAEYADLLATGQADSMMGFYGMERSATCGAAAAVFPLADYAAENMDRAYFLLWEAMNAVFEAQAASGATAANCVFADGAITIYI